MAPNFQLNVIIHNDSTDSMAERAIFTHARQHVEKGHIVMFFSRECDHIDILRKVLGENLVNADPTYFMEKTMGYGHCVSSPFLDKAFKLVKQHAEKYPDEEIHLYFDQAAAIDFESLRTSMRTPFKDQKLNDACSFAKSVTINARRT